MRQLPPDELVKLQQEMLAREVDEEVKRESMRKMWAKYRWLVVAVVAGAVLGTIGFELYGTWRTKTSLTESDQFESAVISAFTGKQDEALTTLSALAADGSTGYKYLATLKSASILMNKGDKDTAYNLLTQLMNDTSAPREIRDTARLSLVGNQVDSADPAALQSLLKPVLVESNAFYGSAVELSAVLYLKQGQKDNAAALLKQASANTRIPENIRARLAELLSAVGK